ncbi:outer membrane protein assembly factor BamB family protein [Melioribacter sp. Ez-97]|uniref:outer membrane protein assembly factor BamB family protein n=1 Tax=Melioribacter sp. Ez-97 TaxID=3423434 RepID=UPI003ED8573E
MKKVLLIIASVLVFNSCVANLLVDYRPVDGNGYVMFGAVPERKFYSNIEIPDSLKLVRKLELKGSHANTSVIAGNGLIFTGDLSGRIYAFDIETGKSYGYKKYDGEISTAPALIGRRIYFVVNKRNKPNSVFVTFDYFDGKEINRYELNGSVSSELLILNDRIFIVDNEGEIYNFNTAGYVEWTFKTYEKQNSHPSSDGKIIAWGANNGKLIIFSEDRKKIVDTFKADASVTSGTVIDNRVIYFGDAIGNLYAYNYSRKKLIWKINTGAKIINFPVHNDSLVISGNLKGIINAVYKESGKLKWSVKIDGLVNATPLMTGNILLQPDLNKKIYLIDAANGEIRKTLHYDGRAKLNPVYYRDYIITGADRGIIYIYDYKSDG